MQPKPKTVGAAKENFSNSTPTIGVKAGPPHSTHNERRFPHPPKGGGGQWPWYPADVARAQWLPRFDSDPSWRRRYP